MIGLGSDKNTAFSPSILYLALFGSWSALFDSFQRFCCKNTISALFSEICQSYIYGLSATFPYISYFSLHSAFLIKSHHWQLTELHLFVESWLTSHDIELRVTFESNMQTDSNKMTPKGHRNMKIKVKLSSIIWGRHFWWLVNLIMPTSDLPTGKQS